MYQEALHVRTCLLIRFRHDVSQISEPRKSRRRQTRTAATNSHNPSPLPSGSRAQLHSPPRNDRSPKPTSQTARGAVPQMQRRHPFPQVAVSLYNLLQLSLVFFVPASLKNVPTKYNIVARLWTHSFHKLLESLHRGSFSSPVSLKLLQGFIYYAYNFYISLVKDPQLSTFRSGSLGNLARYCIIVAAALDSRVGNINGGLMVSAFQAANEMNKADGLEVPVSGTVNRNSRGKKSISDLLPVGRIASQPPSVGIAAVRLLEVEPEKDRWRNIARDWYATSLFEQPGTRKLHHHLGLLYREVKSEELRVGLRLRLLEVWFRPSRARGSRDAKSCQMTDGEIEDDKEEYKG